MPNRPLSEIAHSHAQHWLILANNGSGLRVVEGRQLDSTARLLEKLAEDSQRKSEALKRILDLAADSPLLTEALASIGLIASAALGQPGAFSRDLFDAFTEAS